MASLLHPTRAWPIAGSILMVAGLWLWLAAPVVEAGLLARFRLDPFSGWAPAVRLLTDAGGFRSLGPLALAMIALLLLRNRRQDARWLLVAIGSGRMLVEAAKLVLARPRPPLPGRLDEVTSLSFPSSHAAGSMLTMLALALLFGRDRPWLTPALAAFALAVGWSRLALGVHWPGDVLAGWGFALLWIGTASRWLPARKRAAA